MLRYRDFASSDTFETAVQAAGTWIKDHRVHVMNIETVVLTSVSRSSQPMGVAVPPEGGAGTYWQQFVRVWYDDELERQPYR